MQSCRLELLFCRLEPEARQTLARGPMSPPSVTPIMYRVLDTRYSHALWCNEQSVPYYLQYYLSVKHRGFVWLRRVRVMRRMRQRIVFPTASNSTILSRPSYIDWPISGQLGRTNHVVNHTDGQRSILVQSSTQ